ncbi:MAG: T9SS type A sorting domain-containing protein [Flavobacteriales bacterium]|nr:T9SS type A sorting domain-containing protein [Flavobacteriales bacterium]
MKPLRYLPLAFASALPAALAAQAIVITFEGSLRGSPIPLDSIHVENLTAGGDTMLHHPDTTLVLDFSTGIRDYNGDAAPIRSMPNPFGGSTEIMVTSTGGEMRLAVHDAMGREVAARRVDAPVGLHRFRYSSGMPGLYIVSVEQNGQRRTLRMVAAEGTGHALSELTHLGGSGMAKSDRSLFTWQPGDQLRYIGYASNDTAMFSGVIEHTPVASTTRTFTFFGVTCPDAPTVMDADGNVYPVVRIGEQCWMGTNLRTAHYSDGSAIPNVTNNNAWLQVGATGAWSNYDNSAAHGATYGKLYNWYAATDPRGVCPMGWHVPTDAEWKQLESTLGMPADELNSAGTRGEAQNVGGMLKSTAVWNAPNTGATNETGFSGLPGGARGGFDEGTFFNLGTHGEWWTSSNYGEFNFAVRRQMRHSNGGIGRFGYYKGNGYCIRCLRD